VTGRDDDFLARTEPFSEPQGGGVEHSSSGYAEGLRHGRAERRSWRHNQRRGAVRTAFVVGAGVMGAAVVAAAAFTVLVFAGLYTVSPGLSRDHRAATLEQQSPSTTTPSSPSDATDPSSPSDATDPSSPSTAAQTGRVATPRATAGAQVPAPSPSNSSGLEQLSSASLTAPRVAPAPAPTTAPSESPTCQGDPEKSPRGRGGQRSKCSRS
jgi:cytoskeletal protein RodZ